MLPMISAFFAGLGIFSLGVYLSSETVKGLFTHRIQQLMIRSTKKDHLGAIWGIITGFLTQEVLIVTFLVASLSSKQGLTLRRSLPIVHWANVGTCLIMPLIFMGLNDPTMLLIGIFGIMMMMERYRPKIQIIQFIMGMLLLLYGLILIDESINHFLTIDSIKRWFIHWMEISFLLSFISFALFGFLAQSLIPFILAIQLGTIGIFNLEQILLLSCAIHFGFAFSTWFIFSSFTGIAKKIALSQVFFDIALSSIFTLILLGEMVIGYPLIPHLLQWLSADLSMQVALFILFINTFTALLLTLGIEREYVFFERWEVQEETHHLESLAFLGPFILESPTTAYKMFYQEYVFLSNSFAKYLDFIKTQMYNRGNTKYDLDRTHQKFHFLFNELQEYIKELNINAHTPEISKDILDCYKILDHLVALEQNLYQNSSHFYKVSEHSNIDIKTKHFISNLFDMERSILSNFQKTLENPTEQAIQTMDMMIKNQQHEIDRIKQAGRHHLHREAKHQSTGMLFITFFERNILFINQILTEVKESAFLIKDEP